MSEVEDPNQLKLFMSPREIMQRNWAKGDLRPRIVGSGQRMEGGRDDFMPVEWLDPEDDHFFREGTHGQSFPFKPGYYRYQAPPTDPFYDWDLSARAEDVEYTTTDEKGYGAVLSVAPATEEPYGKYGFYVDNDPRNDPDYFDEDQQPKNLAGLLTDSLIDDDVEYEPEPLVQGEMFRQRKGAAHSLFANIENRSRTLSLLGVAARDQARNFGPVEVSSSLTPDSFRLLTRIEEVEKDKKTKTVAWEPGDKPKEPWLRWGDMRPTSNEGVHEDHTGSGFPSQMLRIDEVDYNLASRRLTQFTEAEVKEGKRFVREQWTSRKPRGKKIPATNKSAKQLSLFPQGTNL